MTIEELNNYQVNSKRTCTSLGDLKLDLAHMVIGIFSEENEILEAFKKQDKINIGEEIGDQLFYIANYMTFRNIDFSEYIIQSNKFESLPYSNLNKKVYYLSNLQDVVKKYIAYNKTIDINKESEYLSGLISCILDTILYEKLDIMDILKKNINKLKVRFPDKFTEELAINRNISNELKVLI